MSSKQKYLKKTIFNSQFIRNLTDDEFVFYQRLLKIYKHKKKITTIAKLPGFISHDNKNRPLILRREIINKIERGHGKILLENLIINANDWDYVIRNVDNNKVKINLIKQIPESVNFLVIGANRHNGYYIVTHYEMIAKNINRLKNLLQNKGDSLDKTGGAAVPSFATFS